ncbi:DNA recombination protein RmuC [Mariluticola halotolerans]|uniref:DNA recombination protein RmuC n=1 Tax=Mariluticola halotolerans TaxID=2909283 RepID=UPI0026E37113|nr:DNA recombination protein RmuC [Mariluticola halotolerans]UJQ93147.1 DNA recombination protein RmuC [Mariluticola halotolerans]
MNTLLFNLGGWPVTYGAAALFAFGLIAALLVAVLIALFRGNTRRAEEAAQLATEGLRTNFLQQLAERDGRIRDLDNQLQQQRQANANLQADAAALRAQMAEQLKQNEANLTRFQTARQQMTDEFKAIAGEVLKSHGETFSKQNREQVDTLLKPLNDKIVEFQTGLLRDRAEMGERIRALAESNLQITTEAHNLTRALKGNSQTQGAWGEMILETILERSGLRAGEQFITQQSHTGEDGSRLRTDVEILMPNGDRLVIDSKVSLTAFEAFTNCEDDDERQRHLLAHVTSIRGHVKTLGEKNYQRHANSSLDYVMMFVPIESALSTAVNADAKLFEYGMNQGVMLTTPTTLMTVLRTVRNVWDIEKRHQNAEEIAARAGTLYDKVAGFLTNMDKLGLNLGRAQQSFEDARNQLSGGRGSVVRQVEMLRELGAKTGKPLPAGWDNGANGEGDAPQLGTPDARTDDD